MNDVTTLLEIGRLGRPHGIRGDLRIFLHNPKSDIVDQLKTLHLVSPDGGEELTLTVLKCRRSGDGRALIVCTHECKDRESAERRTGWRLMYPVSQLAPLNKDEYYFYQLTNATVVTSSGDSIGTVREVMELGVDTLRIVRADESELMVPIVRDFVLDIDIETSQITVVDDINELLGVEE